MQVATIFIEKVACVNWVLVTRNSLYSHSQNSYVGLLRWWVIRQTKTKPRQNSHLKSYDLHNDS